MPISSASIESRPRPPSNNDSPTSIAAGSIPSSLSVVTISSLISFSRLSANESVIIKPFDPAHDVASRHRAIAVALPTDGANPTGRRHSEFRSARRNRPPFVALREGWRYATDQRQLDIGLQQCRNVSKAAMEVQRNAGPRTGAFREDDQAATVGQRRAASSDQGFRFKVVRNIAAAAHNAPEKGTIPQFTFHDALCARDERRQKNDIEQGRMVGDHNNALALTQEARIVDLDRDHAQPRQHSDECPERPAHDGMITLAPPRRRRGQQINRWESNNGQQ